MLIFAVGCGVKGLPLPPDDPAPIFNKNLPKVSPTPTEKSNMDSLTEKK